MKKFINTDYYKTINIFITKIKDNRSNSYELKGSEFKSYDFVFTQTKVLDEILFLLKFDNYVIDSISIDDVIYKIDSMSKDGSIHSFEVTEQGEIKVKLYNQIKLISIEDIKKR